MFIQILVVFQIKNIIEVPQSLILVFYQKKKNTNETTDFLCFGQESFFKCMFTLNYMDKWTLLIVISGCKYLVNIW